MFLTVKEASDLTGKSATTIYRLCNKRRNSLYIKKEDNKFFINRDFLMATYPPEEKRTYDLIENGSKEIGEPVFLEIEPKIKEEIKLSNEEEKVFKLDEDGELIIENIVEFIEDKQNILNAETFNLSENLSIIEETPDSEIISENIVEPFYRRKEFLETFIGLSIAIVALVLLLMLLNYNLN